jgi:acyl-CoA thioesterase I
MVQRRSSVLCLSLLTSCVLSLFLSPRAFSKDVMKIIAYGDSLTAGLGVSPADAFPAQLEKALRARGHQVEIVNAGVSGDTVAAGLERFEWAIPADADGVILELGANDGLRGIATEQTGRTLDQVLARLKARNLPVLIAGMKSPRNWGDQYATAFDGMFPALATKYGALLYPFYLDGVALDPALNQSDGLHPTAKGYAVIVDRILPQTEKLLEQAKSRKP